MPQLLIDHLPLQQGPNNPNVYRHTYRHWLVFEDGRIYFQDETFDKQRGQFVGPSRRTEWEQLPTPPVTFAVVGIIDHGGLPMALLANGEAYIWATEVGEAIPRWIKFGEPVPGTHAALGLDAEGA